MLQEIYYNWFNKESAALSRLHEIKVRVAAEHLRPLARQHSPPSQQPNKRPRHNNKKEIRTRVTKTIERTGISNKDNVQTEMNMTIADPIALGIVDRVALRQHDTFFSLETTINGDNALSPLNRNSGNRPLVYQSHHHKRSCQNNSKE